MSLWMIRAGHADAFTHYAKDMNLAILGFNQVHDLSNIEDIRTLNALIVKSYPDRSKAVCSKWTKEIGHFLWDIAPGDSIIMPIDKGQRFLIGRWCGQPYRYRPELSYDGPHIGYHTRPVNWLKEITRACLDPKLWASLQDRRTIKLLPSSFLSILSLECGAISTPPNGYSEALEGLLRLTEVKILSRDRKLVEAKWHQHVSEHRGLGQCEVCEFEHETRSMLIFTI